jgi:hypothetical protein
MMPLVLMQAQETYFYGTNNRPLVEETNAILKKVVNARSDNSFTIKTYQRKGEGWKKILREKIKRTAVTDYQINRTGVDNLFPKKMERTILKTDHSLYQFRDKSKGTLIREGSSSKLMPLHLDGEVREYFPDGSLKSISTFRDNQLKGNQNWLADGSPYIDSIFYSVDRQPAYEFGGQFFNSYLIRMLEESEIDIRQVQDEIVLGMVIMETGELKKPIILKGKIKQLNQALLDIIAGLHGTWMPAVLDGNPVRYFYTLPINISQRDITFQNLEVSSGVLHYDAF